MHEQNSRHLEALHQLATTARARAGGIVRLGAAGAIAFSLATFLVSCASDPTQGYSTSSTFRSDVKSVAVNLFDNRTFSPGLEQRLGEALVVQLRTQTPYAVTDVVNAQSVLEGVISNAELRKLSTARSTGLGEELAVQLTVDFTWKDARSGRVLTARRNFTTARSFVPAQGVGERIEVGQNATIEQLAKDIVSEMRSGW